MSVSTQEVMTLNLAMLTEEYLDAGGHQEPQPAEPLEWNYKDFNFEDVDLLFVAMDDTHFALVDDCCSETDGSSHISDCLRRPEEPSKAESICNSTQIGISKFSRTNLFMKSFLQDKYVAPLHRQICLEDTMSAQITVCYHVKGLGNTQLGVPVLLNFSGTENYFSCTEQGEEKILTVKPYDTSKLQCMSAEDKRALVFYMSQSASKLYCFESALYSGWFIHTVDSKTLKIQRENITANTSFFLINSDTTKTVLHCKQFSRNCNKSC